MTASTPLATALVSVKKNFRRSSLTGPVASAAAPVSQMVFSAAPAARSSRSAPVRPPAKKKPRPAPPPKRPARTVVKAKASPPHPPVKPAARRKTR